MSKLILLWGILQDTFWKILTVVITYTIIWRQKLHDGEPLYACSLVCLVCDLCGQWSSLISILEALWRCTPMRDICKSCVSTLKARVYIELSYCKVLLANRFCWLLPVRSCTQKTAMIYTYCLSSAQLVSFIQLCTQQTLQCSTSTAIIKFFFRLRESYENLFKIVHTYFQIILNCCGYTALLFLMCMSTVFWKLNKLYWKYTVFSWILLMG